MKKKFTTTYHGWLIDVHKKCIDVDVIDVSVLIVLLLFIQTRTKQKNIYLETVILC